MKERDLEKRFSSARAFYSIWEQEQLGKLFPLAYSPRVTAYLVRKGLYQAPVMALTAVEPLVDRKIYNRKPMPDHPPPSIATTPADPWPRPYYFEDGLRKVAPYHFTYNTNCKERWRGRELLDIFSTEFRDRPVAYYVTFFPRVALRNN